MFLHIHTEVEITWHFPSPRNQVDLGRKVPSLKMPKRKLDRDQSQPRDRVGWKRKEEIQNGSSFAPGTNSSKAGLGRAQSAVVKPRRSLSRKTGRPRFLRIQLCCWPPVLLGSGREDKAWPSVTGTNSSFPSALSPSQVLWLCRVRTRNMRDRSAYYRLLTPVKPATLPSLRWCPWPRPRLSPSFSKRQRGHVR